MANRVYELAKQGLIEGAFNLLGNPIRAVLVDLADYTPNFNTDKFLSDIPLAGRVAISPGLTGKSTTLGTFDAADTTISAVTGDQCEALVIFQDSGDPTTSRLLIYLDTGVGGLPVTPSGADVLLVWNNGSEKIMKVG